MYTLRLNIVLFLFSFFHPVHVSITSIEYIEGKNSFEVSFKLFWDDFEAIIASKYDVLLNLG